MKKIIYLALLILLVVGCSSKVNAASNQVLSVEVPSTIYAFNNSRFVIMLNDPVNATPISGERNNIFCYLQDPNGNMRLNGANPSELQPGIYIMNFSVNATRGTYLAWAKINYSGNIYSDAAVFEARFDIYDNLSAMTYRIGDILDLTTWQVQNSSREIISHINANRLTVSESKTETEKLGITSVLRDKVLGQIMSWGFTGAMMLGTFVIATWLYGRRRAIELAKNVANLPGVVMSELEKKV